MSTCIRKGPGNELGPQVNREIVSIVHEPEYDPDSASPLLGDFRQITSPL